MWTTYAVLQTQHGWYRELRSFTPNTLKKSNVCTVQNYGIHKDWNYERTRVFSNSYATLLCCDAIVYTRLPCERKLTVLRNYSNWAQTWRYSATVSAHALGEFLGKAWILLHVCYSIVISMAIGRATGVTERNVGENVSSQGLGSLPVFIIFQDLPLSSLPSGNIGNA